MTLSELRRFLYLPAAASSASAKKQTNKASDDDEPLVTWLAANTLVRQTVQQIILSAAQTNVDAALADWPDRFARAYADERLRSRAPEDAFGEIDQSALKHDLHERIHGQGGIEAFVREHAGTTFCGPVLLGSAMTPLDARLRFPGLDFALADTLQARLVGWTHLAWHSPQRFEIMIVSNAGKMEGDKIHPALIEPALLHLALFGKHRTERRRHHRPVLARQT